MAKVVKIILAILFFMCLANLPYGFYTFVRFVALAGFVFLSYQSSLDNNKTVMIIYVFLALLFQPIFKIALGREIWNAIDVSVGLGLLISLFNKK